MEFQSLSPNVIVTDVKQTVDYYTSLGFVCLATVPESEPLNWAMVQRDNITLMFQSLESIQEDLPSLNITEKGSLGTFFIKMRGLDEWYLQIKNKVSIASDMRTTFYGMKEFTIRDLNGYYLTFAEDL